MSTQVKRFFQLFLTGIFAVSGIGWLVSAFRMGSVPLAIASVVPFFLSALFFSVMELQRRSFARSAAAVKEAITACSTSVFDSPGRVVPGYDLDATLTSQLWGGLFREPDNDAAFTTEGRHGDVKVSVASHVSVLGRQFGESHHTYSHVLVDVLGLTRPFAITRERLGAKLVKAVGASSDVQVGDKAFDDTFLVATDEALARDVLDESIRSRLMALQAQVKNVSSDMGVGGMVVVLTDRGLALRWPGDLTPELAAHVRDLLFDLQERLLAHENRLAVRVGTAAAGGYRVAT